MTIRQLRKAAGFPNPDLLATALGIHVNTLVKIETGEREPSDQTLADIANTLAPELEVRPGWVLARLDEVPQDKKEAAETLAKEVNRDVEWALEHLYGLRTTKEEKHANPAR